MGELVPDDGFSFDLVAASLRADAADMGGFLGALAVKLEGALPGQCEVKREGGLFKKERKVEAITVQLGEQRFDIRRTGPSLEARVAHQVRGITLKSEVLALERWIEALARSLHEHAQASAEARAALSRMVE